jgi:hypothetical protein
MRIIRMGSSCLAGGHRRAGRGRHGVSPCRFPRGGHYHRQSQDADLHCALQPVPSAPPNPKPDPTTGFGSGDELTFHDLLFSYATQPGPPRPCARQPAPQATGDPGPSTAPSTANRPGRAGMPSAVGTTERQKCLFGAVRTAMSNDRDWRQIGGSARGYQGVGGPLSSPGTAY